MDDLIGSVCMKVYHTLDFYLFLTAKNSISSPVCD